MEGYVHEQDGKRWNKCWYVIKNDLALYKFKAHEVISYNCALGMTLVDWIYFFIFLGYTGY